MPRQFFRDCAEWGWVPRRFDPGRSLATPRSVKVLIGSSPRIIADELWAKLLWAGLNLSAEDLPVGKQYPLEMVRALALSWLFGGLRSNETVRLRLGCVRWQLQQGDADEQAVCLLDVPAHKSGTAFTKPRSPRKPSRVLRRPKKAAFHASLPIRTLSAQRVLRWFPRSRLRART